MVTCTFYILNLAGFRYETKTTLVAEIVVFNFFQLNKKFYSKSQISHKTNTEVISFLELVSNPIVLKNAMKYLHTKPTKRNTLLGISVKCSSVWIFFNWAKCFLPHYRWVIILKQTRQIPRVPALSSPNAPSTAMSSISAGRSAI